MEPNSEAELKAFGYVLNFCISFPSLSFAASALLDDADIDVLLETAAKWGCSVRMCLQVARKRLNDLEMTNLATKAAKEFAQDPFQFLRLGECTSGENVSHMVICERPMSKTNRSAQRTEIPTEHIQEIIAKQVAEADVAQQSYFFTQISSHPWLKSSSGYLFEKFLFIRLTAPSQSQPLICKAVISTSSQPSELIIPTCATVIPLSGISGLSDARIHPLPFCWRPTSPNFAVVDAIICTEEEVILLQCTVSPDHSLDVDALDQILDKFPKRFLSPRRRCLVYPTMGENVRMPGPAGLAKKNPLSIFSCIHLIPRPHHTKSAQ
jgi:hypothetical protein